MDAKVIWLFVFVALYWTYCIFWGIKGALSAKTASDYFIAGRSISLWVFVLAATATSFSGWTFMGHPGLIYRDGFQYAYASFYAITIPFTGVMFLKRQWMLGKRFGFVTPGEMLSDYFKSDAVRLLVVLVALVFSVPYLGVQLRASGFLFNVLTDGMLGVEVGMWLLSAVVIIYVASGGLRAVAYVDTMQAILLAFGIVAIGIIAISYVGGWDRLNEGIAALAQMDENQTPDGYSHYIAIPGVIQFVSDGPKATGGAWTGIMILTYMFALMGIQSAPAFTMWSFSNHNPRPFAPQQVWASSFGIGFILFFFTAMQGIGGHLLGADTAFAAAHPELVNNVMSAGLGGQDLMESEGKQGILCVCSSGDAIHRVGVHVDRRRHVDARLAKKVCDAECYAWPAKVLGPCRRCAHRLSRADCGHHLARCPGPVGWSGCGLRIPDVAGFDCSLLVALVDPCRCGFRADRGADCGHPDGKHRCAVYALGALAVDDSFRRLGYSV